MRDDICTIPLSEIFEVQDGCPICRMRNTVEQRILDYTMGSAMMEPDVRQETNTHGFCTTHLHAMGKRGGRHALALILESHLAEIREANFGKKKLFGPSPAKRAEALQTLEQDCFICTKINWGMERMQDTLYRLYESESDFRRMLNNQPAFCLPHYTWLLAGASKKRMPQQYAALAENLTRITGGQLADLERKVHAYAGMYDYRNAGPDADWGDFREAIEDSTEFLTSRRP